jgi:hypothetical protein
MQLFQGWAMLRTLIFVGALLTPSLSFAQQAIGAQEIEGAFSAIERRCAADLPRTFAPAIAGINALVVEHGDAPIEAEATRHGVLRAYATALASTPALDEAELARAAVQSIGTAADGQREDDYYIDFRVCYRCARRERAGQLSDHARRHQGAVGSFTRGRRHRLHRDPILPGKHRRTRAPGHSRHASAIGARLHH